MQSDLERLGMIPFPAAVIISIYRFYFPGPTSLLTKSASKSALHLSDFLFFREDFSSSAPLSASPRLCLDNSNREWTLINANGEKTTAKVRNIRVHLRPFAVPSRFHAAWSPAARGMGICVKTPFGCGFAALG